MEEEGYLAYNLLCLVCGEETHLQENEEVDSCPACGDRAGIPADLDKMLTIRITEHELRVLTMWADNHARKIGLPHVTRTILDRLSLQTPIALSLSQELATYRAKYPDLEIRVLDRDGNEVDI